jgi:cytochrome c1
LDSELVNKIHDKVKNVKHNNAMEVEYLKFEELMKESRQEGIDIGRSEGQNMTITAIQRLKKGAAPQELLSSGF